MFRGTDEALSEEFCFPFTFCPHMVGDQSVGRYHRVVRLGRRVEAAEGDSGAGCLVVGLGDDEARGTGDTGSSTTWRMLLRTSRRRSRSSLDGFPVMERNSAALSSKIAVTSSIVEILGMGVGFQRTAAVWLGLRLAGASGAGLRRCCR